jgi:uncharacterized membrane protein YtjA (UPF0391 family)
MHQFGHPLAPLTGGEQTVTHFITTLVLFLMSIATGIYAFGGFGNPAPTIAFVLFSLFSALMVLSATFEYFDYKAHLHHHIR